MKRERSILAWALPALVLVAACGGGGEEARAPVSEAQPAPTATAAAPSGSGSIQGVALYQNGDPDTQIAMDADPVCASLHGDAVHSEKVVHDDAGQLANVFVYVKEGLAGKTFPAPSSPHLLDQVGCQYRPHVSGMMVGQKLIIRNSDPTLHNVHALPTANKEFNMGQPFQGMEIEHTFDQREMMIPFKCDVHPWMASWMAVLEHPFFGVSGENGAFSIQSLPAGTYVVEAWHEELGTRSESVTLAEGESVELSFDFSPTG